MTNNAMISDNTLDIGSDQDEEEKTLDPDHIEERFRVDRRKLEQMIQAHCGVDEDGTADDFFHKIMEDTNTRITWPSKLKIGAKSKKDPHIKVSGHKDAVADAKEKIMAVLDTKSSRVTLKMDVSHIEHSHVIGKGGYNIKRVMQETGCHIHFPDSNRNTQAEKSNQVSIAGQPKGVEQARQKIRELLPLVLMFELPVAGLLHPLPDASSPQIQQIQNSYGVTISFKQRSQVYVTTVIVRGSVCNSKSVKDATAVLIEHLTGSVGTAVPVSMQLDIAPQHHLFIIGRGGANIKQIMQLTRATIHFPDPSTSTTQRKGTVYITGSIDSVLLARQHLIGCLPLVLMFDMKEDTELDQNKISHLMEQLDVYISIKPKPKQPSKSVIVKSIERNIANLYEARSRLLGVSSDVPRAPPTSGVYAAACNGNIPVGNIVYRPMMVLAPHGGFTSPIHPAAAAAYSVYSPHNGLKQPEPNFVTQNGLKVDVVQASLCSNKPPVTPSSVPSEAQPSEIGPGGSVPRTCASQSMLRASSPPSASVSSPVMSSPPRPRQAKTNQQSVSVEKLFSDSSLQVSPQHVVSSSASDASAEDSVRSASEATSPDTLQLLNNVMSMSLLHDSITAPIANLSFSKNDIQDAVTSMQNKAHLLQQMNSTEPSIGDQRTTTDILNQLRPADQVQDNLSADFSHQCRTTNHLQDTRNIPHDHMSIRSEQRPMPSEQRQVPSEQRSIPSELFESPIRRDPMPSVLSNITAPNPGPRRVKTPPGFSGPPRGHKEHSPLGQFSSHFDKSHYLFESASHVHQQASISNHNSQLDLESSSSPLGFSGAPIRSGMDSPLGSLGSPLAPRSSPLGGSGSPRTSQGSPIGRTHTRPFQNGDARSSESGCDSDGSDCRAPGSNRPKKLLQDLFSPPAGCFSTFDYEHKKLLATKAMQKKPEGESRIPTDFWSGLGFSKSMPESAIRDRLNANNGRYQGPSMTTTYECAYDEAEGEGWDDQLREESCEGEGLPNHVSAAPGEYPRIRKKASEHSPQHSMNHGTDEGMMTRSPLHSSNGPEDGIMTRSPLHSSSHGTDDGMMTRSPLHSSRAEDSVGVTSSHEWTRQPDLVELFSKRGLGKYTDLFIQQEIDLSTFLTLTDQDLKELGITTFGARRKMLIAIADLNKRQTLQRANAVGSGNLFGSPDPALMHSSRPRHDIASQSGRW